MSKVKTVFESALHSLPLVHRGKVRDLYRVDDEHMLLVATDRISAFDVVLPSPIPDKGVILTAMSRFWFERFRELIANHIDRATSTLHQALPEPAEREQVEHRAVVVRQAVALPVEAIVRGYLIGSGWREYRQNRHLCGIELPAGMEMAEQLAEPLFTPSTKAAAGSHDENISFAQLRDLLGERIAEQIRRVSLTLYSQAADYAAQRGIIIADTKFEFGLDQDGQVMLIDELLTPDSSRFWPASEYRAGISPPSLDKQYLRDYLETLDWPKTAPGPELPDPVVEHTAAIYRRALAQLVD